MAAPDAIEPVIGWRTWRLVKYRHPKGPWPNPTPDDEGRFRLMSPISLITMWRPGKAHKASCNSNGTHDAPEVDCGCGLYARSRSGPS